MKKLIVKGIFLCFMLLVCGVSLVQAGEMDVLLQTLVDKGVITSSEAQQIKINTQEQVKKEIAQGKSSSLPDWVQRIKLKGDFRLRYEGVTDKNVGTSGGTTQNNNMARIRMRLGLDAKVNEQIKAGVGIATGTTSNPRSTNWTLGYSANTGGTPASFKNIILDYVYGEYTPVPWATAIGGKFKNNIWQPTDLLWDTDLNPEGVGLNLSKRFGLKLSGFMNNMVFFMRNEERSGAPANLFAIQPGLSYAFNDNINLKGALAAYIFNGVQGKQRFSTYGGTNTLSGSAGSTSSYVYNYNSINPSFELGVKNPLGSTKIPYFAFYGDYIYNVSSKHPKNASSRYGYDIGFKFGDEKVSDWKQWQVKALWARLGRDSWMDIFPDSDRYNGKTNMKSAELIYEFGLGKNSSIVVDYYYAQSLTKTGTGFAPQSVIQIDWNLKF